MGKEPLLAFLKDLLGREFSSPEELSMLSPNDIDLVKSKFDLDGEFCVWSPIDYLNDIVYSEGDGSGGEESLELGGRDIELPKLSSLEVVSHPGLSKEAEVNSKPTSFFRINSKGYLVKDQKIFEHIDKSKFRFLDARKIEESALVQMLASDLRTEFHERNNAMHSHVHRFWLIYNVDYMSNSTDADQNEMLGRFLPALYESQIQRTEAHFRPSSSASQKQAAHLASKLRENLPKTPRSMPYLSSSVFFCSGTPNFPVSDIDSSANRVSVPTDSFQRRFR